MIRIAIAALCLWLFSLQIAAANILQPQDTDDLSQTAATFKTLQKDMLATERATIPTGGADYATLKKAYWYMDLSALITVTMYQIDETSTLALASSHMQSPRDEVQITGILIGAMLSAKKHLAATRNDVISIAAENTGDYVFISYTNRALNLLEKATQQLNSMDAKIVKGAKARQSQ